VLFSTIAVAQGMAFHASIAAAKGAVEGLTRSLAAELAPKIRVNAIAPSLTDTPLANTLLNSDAKREAAAKRHPLQQVGRPEDVAKLTAFLLSDDSSFITGQILRPDGGLSSLRVF
jgi:NAD(P)-dependent dehydrogenase (short-subunit alcohol dehydrogenase family)